MSSSPEVATPEKSPVTTRTRWRRRCVWIGLLLLIGWLASSALVTWRLTRRDSPRYTEALPDLSGVKVEDLQLTTSDTETIGAWLIRGDADKACAIVTHGRGGTRRHRLAEIKLLADHGYSVVAITHRALGDSTGEINDVGWSGKYDVMAAVSHAEQVFPDQPIVIVGQSMGAAAAIFAAEDLGERVAGYVLEQPYRDLDSAVWHRLQHYLPIGFDYAAYLGMNLWAPILLPFDIAVVSPERYIDCIPESVPVAILCGSDDPHCPLEDVQQVFQQVESHAKLSVFETDTHAPLFDTSPTGYQSVVINFLEQADSLMWATDQ